MVRSLPVLRAGVGGRTSPQKPHYTDKMTSRVERVGERISLRVPLRIMARIALKMKEST